MLARFGEYLLQKVLMLIGSELLQWLEEVIKNGKRKAIQGAAKKEYDKVLAKPEATPEERAKAYENYINAGRL